MNALLRSLTDASRARVQRQDPGELDALASRVAPLRLDAATRPAFQQALAGRDAVSLIAEFKRRSPSDPELAPDSALAEQVAGYEAAGASAVSVLTEASRFGGSYADFVEAGRRTRLPLLMKDFVVDVRQVEVAHRLGASAVLLIVRCLRDEGALLRELIAASHALGLDVLLECHGEDELDVALDFERVVIGVNNRDLDTMDVDTARAARLLPRIPASRVAVAESGYASSEALAALRGVADAALVGTWLMQGGLRGLSARAPGVAP